MKRYSLAILIGIFAALFSGCLLHELNGGHFHSYYTGGNAAFDAGDFSTAKRRYARAYWYAQSGLGPQAEAAALYNYALSTGHLGNFEEAEDCLKRAMVLDEKTEGRMGSLRSKRLFELARLYQAWGKLPEAIKSYEEAIPLATCYGAHQEDPIGFAIVLEDYATVLEKIGLDSEAKSNRELSEKVRNDHRGSKAKVKILYY